MSDQFFGTHRLVPQLLIGHSLGGAAMLSVAAELPSVRAVATIAAPAFAGHVMHLFSESMDEIQAKAKAQLSIGGRPFTIGAELVNDLNARMTPDYIASLTKDLLILHGPLDEIVSIDHAAMIFAHAKHPKSFVSLNRADHLLSRPEDARFAADMIASWARRCLPDNYELTQSGEGDVKVRASPDGLFAHDIIAGSSVMRADEPTNISGGLDSGPPPYDFLLAGLGACTAMTLRLYARNKNWPLTDVDVYLSHKKNHASDSLHSQRLDVIDRAISLKGPLSAAQKARLMEIADKCPVHKSLQTGLLVQTRQM